MRFTEKKTLTYKSPSDKKPHWRIQQRFVRESGHNSTSPLRGKIESGDKEIMVDQRERRWMEINQINWKVSSQRTKLVHNYWKRKQSVFDKTQIKNSSNVWYSVQNSMPYRRIDETKQRIIMIIKFSFRSRLQKSF